MNNCCLHPSLSCTRTTVGPEVENRLIDKFSFFSEGMLYLVKVFGIIVFFDRHGGCVQERACSTMNVVFCYLFLPRSRINN